MPGTASPRLLALDLDGTLLRADGSVDPRDRAAIDRARAQGVVVTLATGRVAAGALPTARSLGLTTPIVVADGGLVLSPVTGEWFESHVIPHDVAERLVLTMRRHGLSPFVITHARLHCQPHRWQGHAMLHVWTREVQVHAELVSASAWHDDGPVALGLGVGARDAMMAFEEELAHAFAQDLEHVTFRMPGGDEEFAVLVRPEGCNKAAGLAHLARRLGVDPAHAAVVGDWFNDVPMFAWAGRSFAMGQSPHGVRSCATDVLAATSATGGGVAEAVDRWLGAALQDACTETS